MLTDNEITVLQYLYKHGTSPARSISLVTKISKISVLYILDSLQKKELVIKKRLYNKFLYTAKDPKNVLKLYDSQLEQLTKDREAAQALVQKFKEYRNFESNDAIYYFDNQAEIRRIRSMLMEGPNSRDLKRSFDPKLLIDIFESDNYVYIFSMKDWFGVRIDPKQITGKFVSLLCDFNKINQDNL